VITDADLDKAECQKLAEVAHDGLARAIRPAHSMNDGDTIFGLATQTSTLGASATTDSPFLDRSTRAARFNLLLEAAADTFARACTMAVLRATGSPGLPSYRDLVPSAFRQLPPD
jgi:L-aminopeptidase/D-esterase-like protein